MQDDHCLMKSYEGTASYVGSGNMFAVCRE
jgi:hypothetical protein